MIDILKGTPNEVIHFYFVIDFDIESLASVPRPAAAVIFLFPITDSYEAFREKEETHLKVLEQNISPNLVYFKQTISNACGMMALLHSIANNEHLVVGKFAICTDKWGNDAYTRSGPGIFKKILEETRNMSPEERAEYLESCQELMELHDAAAHEGQTKVQYQTQ